MKQFVGYTLHLGSASSSTEIEDAFTDQLMAQTTDSAKCGKSCDYLLKTHVLADSDVQSVKKKRKNDHPEEFRKHLKALSY